jgi:hypothetical protein
MNIDESILKVWRLESLLLGAQRGKNPAQVVGWLGGVQAQDERGAHWSIGLRLEGGTHAGVERAIRERQIVRTWMFRGTLHFVAAADLAWLTRLLRPGIIRGNARRYRQLGLDEAAFLRSQNVLQDVLAGETSLTRAEIKAHFIREGVPAEGQQLPYLLQRAALDGLICQALPRIGEPTYVLVSDWAGDQRAVDPAEALRLLALRYFASHAPATQQDFAWWAGLSLAEVRLALDSAPEIAALDVDGVQYWASGDPPTAGETGRACLLPPFDETLLGYKERSLVLDSRQARRVNAGGGMPKPTVLVNGDILGIWNTSVKKRGTTVTIQPFRDLKGHELDLIDQAADQLGSFLSAPVQVSFTPVDLV